MKVVLAAALITFTTPVLVVELSEADIEVLTRNLNDPESARFRNLSNPDDLPSVICGEVNWRGVQGGYMGYKKFWLTGEHSAIEGDDLFSSGAGALGCPR